MKLVRRVKVRIRFIRRLIRRKITKKPYRMFMLIAGCIFSVLVIASIVCLTSGMPRRQVKWNSISSVRVDFRAMVTNRIFAVGTERDAVKAYLNLNEMYFHENDLVLPFRGRVSCSKGTTGCSMDVRAPVRFGQGKVYAGELRLSAFASHGLDLGTDEKFVAATLFMKIKEKIDIRPLKVDTDFKAIHAIYNDFIEFEK